MISAAARRTVAALIAAMLLAPAVVAAAPIHAGAALAGAAVLPPAELEAAVAAYRRGDCAGVLPSLSDLTGSGDPLGSRAGFLRALCLLSIGQREQARAAFAAVAARSGPLAPHAALEAGRLALAAGSAEAALAHLDQALSADRSWFHRSRAAALRAEALIALGRFAQARRAASAVVASPPQDARADVIAARAWYLLGIAAERSGDPVAARRAYAMAWWAVPAAPDSATARRRLAALGGAMSPPAESRVVRARHLAAEGDLAGAGRELRAAVRGRLPPAVAAEAWFGLGMMERGAAARFALRQAARYAHGASRALFWLGRRLAAAGRLEEARAVWRRAVEREPASPWAPRALLALAGSFEASDPIAADRLYAELDRRFPRSPSAGEARWRRGWLRYQRGDREGAQAHFVHAGRANPQAPRAAAGLYWAARTGQTRGGDTGALLADVALRYPLTFYGQRARARTGRGLPAVPGMPPPVRVPPDRFAAVHEELAALGWDAQAADEADAALARRSDLSTARTAAHLRAQLGDYPTSVQIAEPVVAADLYGRRAPADAGWWQLAYPRAHWEAVRSAARSVGLDPYLVLAVLREESRFDHRAVSSAGAVGLMQLLPGTAAGIAGRPVGVRGLMDPAANIRYGSAYLGGLVRRFHGDLVLALAAYNAGPGAARRFAGRPRSDEDMFVETIPFAETRAYIQRVLQTYAVYRWLYR